jgi:hypothetical protein
LSPPGSVERQRFWKAASAAWQRGSSSEQSQFAWTAWLAVSFLKRFLYGVSSANSWRLLRLRKPAIRRWYSSREPFRQGLAILTA